MKIDFARYRVAEGTEIQLSKRSTNVEPLYESHKHYRKLIEKKIEKLRGMQNLLYANHSRSLLLIFQAMDAGGKDSAIKHVMSGVNPQGCQVFTFKHPSNAELARDFLWRSTQCLPQRGHIGIFNRSYYEEVLIVRVKPVILLSGSLPTETIQDPDFWMQHYKSIRELESHLHRNGTRTIKFFLHLSKEEQRLRLIKRIDDPEKNWKFSKEDTVQRASWKEY
jgi:PPK2 family polyphosphate:nucleotide phosphotransferase